MSADNIIIITKTQTGYKADDRFVESKKEGNVIGISNDLEALIRIVQKYMRENMVEYGIHFNF